MARGPRAAALLMTLVTTVWMCATLPRAAPASAAPLLTRLPYLTDVVPTSSSASWATVNWATSASGTATVQYGPLAAGACPVPPGGGSGISSATARGRTMWVGKVKEYQWTATFKTSPDARYCYRVFLGGTDLLGSAASPAFWSAIPAGDAASFSFAVLGSWGYPYASPDQDQASLMAQVAGSGARFAVGAGGVAHTGSQASYGDLFQAGGGVFPSAYWGTAGESIPMFPAVGNKGAFYPFVTNWPQPKAVSASGGRSSMETYCCLNGTRSQNLASVWYAFDEGEARFYVLDAAWPDGNTGTGTIYSDDWAYHWQPTSAEYQWLKSDLAAHPGVLKFAFFNFPLYSDGKGHGSDADLTGAGSLEQLLASNGVRFVFNGHAHVYERNVQSAAGDWSYDTGGGGSPLDAMATCHSYDAYGVGWNPSLGRGSACGGAATPTSAASVYHFLLVTVSGGTVTVTPVEEGGDTFDSRAYTP